MGEAQTILHASTVAIAGQAVVILGPSGAGKSSLALRLMALGAALVADDRTCVARAADRIIASAPDTIRGMIEARGVGILSVPDAGPTPVALVVDLSQPEKDRLPQPRSYDLLGHDLPCLHNADSRHFPAAILLYVKGSVGNCHDLE